MVLHEPEYPTLRHTSCNLVAPRIMRMHTWPVAISYADLFARNVRAARAAQQLEQELVAARMRALGYSAWFRQTVARVERGKRRLVAEEILGLAFALQTSVGALMDPSPDDRLIELPSGRVVGANTVLRSQRHFNDGMVWWEGEELRVDLGEPPESLATPESIGARQDAFADFTPDMMIRRNHRIDPPRTQRAAGSQRQEQPVVAVIVTSTQGMLVGRRDDRRPLWGFISGELEPGELPEDAAVREVKEETGFDVRAGQVIGEHDHPATGRHVIYMAAKPTRGTSVFVGDEAELAEVRWVSLAEVDELLPGMFGPVREYLAATTSAGSRS